MSIRDDLDKYLKKDPGYYKTEPLLSPDSAFTSQVAGDHYKTLAIQPVEYIHRNGIGYMEGNVIKYVTRWRAKGHGLEDLKKARHYLDLLIEMEEGKK